MDFDVTDDQRALQDGVRQFCADRFPTDVTRRFGAAGGFDRGAWQELAALGTFGIDLPEQAGGVGLATIDTVLVYEVLGAALVPGPLVGSALAAAVLDGDTRAGVLDGSIVVNTVALAHPSSTLLVEHLPDVDLLLVVAPDGVRLLDAGTVAYERVTHPLDPTVSIARVDELPEGELVGDADDAARLHTRGSLLASALLSGIATATTEIAVAYAKDRQQFGRPIGSFQAIQHMLADCLAVSEIARASLHAAGVVVDDREIADVERAVAGARVLTAKAATANASTCIQVHGGIGFTWEFDAHLYLKRAWHLMSAFGSPDTASQIVAERLVVGATVPVPRNQETS